MPPQNEGLVAEATATIDADRVMSATSSTGVIVAAHTRDGPLVTGSF